MEEAKRVGLVTWLSTGNYGTSLQCYALYTAIILQGCRCAILQQASPRSLKDRALSLIGIYTISNVEQLDTPRMSKLRNLQSRYEVITRGSASALRKATKNFSVICAGSDQIWNTWVSYRPHHFLEFAPAGVKRVSYATSIGTTELNPEHLDRVKAALSPFDRISVREPSARRALSAILPGKQIETVLDPTFLLTPEDWRAFAAESDVEIPSEPYIFSYFVGDRPEYAAQLEPVCEKTGIKTVVNIPSFEMPGALTQNKLTSSQNIKVVSAPDSGEADFVALLDNAALVCTDSYHGIALSINLGIQFLAFKRFNDSDRQSQNSRIYDLLDAFGLKDRLYSTESEVCFSPIDYPTVEATVNRERERSLGYLKEILDD